jgi:hypothetical protein
MILCEHRFEAFNARGADAYFDQFAERLSAWFAQGWALLDSKRETAHVGWWRIELFKETGVRNTPPKI